jgi:hypothetical protein
VERKEEALVMQHDDIDIFEPGSAGARYKKQMQDIYDSSPAFDIEDIQAKGKELSALFPAEREPSIYDLATSLSKGLTEQAASGQPASIGYGLAAGFNAFNEAAQARQKRADDLQQKILQFAYTETEKKRQEQIAINKGALEYQQAIDIAKLKDENRFLEKPDADSFDYIESVENLPDGPQKDEARKSAKYKISMQNLGRLQTRVIEGADGSRTTVLEPRYDPKQIWPSAVHSGKSINWKNIDESTMTQLTQLQPGQSMVVQGVTVTKNAKGGLDF